MTSRQEPDDRREAFRLLGSALERGTGLDLLDRDPDLDAIRDQDEFRRMVESARARRDAANSEGRKTMSDAWAPDRCPARDYGRRDRRPRRPIGRGFRSEEILLAVRSREIGYSSLGRSVPAAIEAGGDHPVKLRSSHRIRTSRRRCRPK